MSAIADPKIGLPGPAFEIQEPPGLKDAFDEFCSLLAALTTSSIRRELRGKSRTILFCCVVEASERFRDVCADLLFGHCTGEEQVHRSSSKLSSVRGEIDESASDLCGLLA